MGAGSAKPMVGDLLIGVTESGLVDTGRWLHLAAQAGRAVVVAELADPSEFRMRSDVLLDGDSDLRPACDLKIAVRAANVESVRMDVVKAFEDGFVHVVGDEAFFIRYSAAILSLLKDFPL